LDTEFDSISHTESTVIEFTVCSQAVKYYQILYPNPVQFY